MARRKLSKRQRQVLEILNERGTLELGELARATGRRHDRVALTIELLRRKGCIVSELKPVRYTITGTGKLALQH